MATAPVAQNNTPSPHSSDNSSPQSQTSRWTVHLYTQEDVARIVQAALVGAYRNHRIIPSTDAQAQTAQEQRIMKPRIHMYETFRPRRTMIITFELPGLQKRDVSVTARRNGDLIISGERGPQHLFLNDGVSEDERNSEPRMQERGRTILNELKFGRFHRVIRLPPGTDPSTVTASMDDGMLAIMCPLPSQQHPAEQQGHHDDELNGANVAEAETRHSDL